MEFNKGMVGVLVVVLSLIASVVLGVVTNVESHTTTKDVEEYMADITGGFSAGKEKSYSDYNPSSNFNGYINNTTSTDFPVNFEGSQFSNNYPITKSSATATSSTFTSPEQFSATATSTTDPRPYPGYFTNYLTHTGYNDNYDVLYYEASQIWGPITAADIYYITPPAQNTTTTEKNLKSILDECKTEGISLLSATPSTIRITIPNTILNVQIPQPHINYGGWGDVSLYYLQNSVFLLNNTENSSSTLPSPYTASDLTSMGAGSSFRIDIIYDTSSNLFTAYLNDNPIYSGNPANYKIRYGYPVVFLHADSGLSGSPGQVSNNIYYLPNTSSHNLQVKYSADTVTRYIDTRYGVGIRNSEEVEWSNNQQNGIVSLAYSVWDDASKTFTDTGTYSTVSTIGYFGDVTPDTFTVSRNGGRTYVTLNGVTTDIGTWNQIQIDLDTINGTMTVTPIVTWDNFNNYTLSTTSTLIGSLKKVNIEKITYTANNSFRLQVVNTTVFFNSYGVVMVDPSITISDLWPNYTRFMIKISKVATVGNSITLGSTTYPITDNAIFVNNTQLNITELDIYYEKVDSNWKIKLVSEKNSAEIVESSTYIGMTGAWYFNAGFYDIVTKQVSENVWNPIYDWFAGNLFFWMAGFTLIGGILVWKLGYADPLSILILIASELILIIIGGAA